MRISRKAVFLFGKSMSEWACYWEVAGSSSAGKTNEKTKGMENEGNILTGF